MPSLIYEGGEYSLLYYLFMTVCLGGAAAWISGSAIAQTWRPLWQIPTYMVLLTAAVRFCHYVLFWEPLLSVRSYLTDFVTLTLLALAGYWFTRRAQMLRQYGWTKLES